MSDKTVLIIADDLSGAADASSAFAMAGLATMIAFEPGPPASGVFDGAEVLAIDTDSRRLDPTQAAEVQVSSWNARRSMVPLLFKKMDSTLRGHFAAETRALIPHAGMAIVAPAFPAARRHTLGGSQFVNGVPLESSEIWRNEGLRGCAHIPTLLQAQGIRTTQLSIDDLQAGPDVLCERLTQISSSGVQAVVCDAQDDADLEAIVRASFGLGVPHFWVGSAGLAPHLAQTPGLPVRKHQKPEVQVQGPILTVVGSASSISRAQAAHLEAHAPHMRIDLPVSVLRGGPSHREWGDISRACSMALCGQQDVLIVIRDEGVVDLNVGGQLTHSLALLMGPLDAAPGAIIATGGETARAVLTAMGVKGLQLLGDVEPGVPISVALGGRRMPVITKAGAFGSEQTLSRCHQYLRHAH